MAQVLDKRAPTEHLKVTELNQFIAGTLAGAAQVRRLLVEQYLFLEVRQRTDIKRLLTPISLFF